MISIYTDTVVKKYGLSVKGNTYLVTRNHELRNKYNSIYIGEYIARNIPDYIIREGFENVIYSYSIVKTYKQTILSRIPSTKDSSIHIVVDGGESFDIGFVIAFLELYTPYIARSLGKQSHEILITILCKSISSRKTEYFSNLYFILKYMSMTSSIALKYDVDIKYTIVDLSDTYVRSKINSIMQLINKIDSKRMVSNGFYVIGYTDILIPIKTLYNVLKVYEKIYEIESLINEIGYVLAFANILLDKASSPELWEKARRHRDRIKNIQKYLKPLNSLKSSLYLKLDKLARNIKDLSRSPFVELPSYSLMKELLRLVLYTRNIQEILKHKNILNYVAIRVNSLINKELPILVMVNNEYKRSTFQKYMVISNSILRDYVDDIVKNRAILKEFLNNNDSDVPDYSISIVGVSHIPLYKYSKNIDILKDFIDFVRNNFMTLTKSIRAYDTLYPSSVRVFDVRIDLSKQIDIPLIDVHGIYYVIKEAIVKNLYRSKEFTRNNVKELYYIKSIARELREYIILPNYYISEIYHLIRNYRIREDISNILESILKTLST